MPIFIYVLKYGYHLIWQLYNIPLWVNTLWVIKKILWLFSPKAHSNLCRWNQDPDFADMERGTWTNIKFCMSKVIYSEWQN